MQPCRFIPGSRPKHIAGQIKVRFTTQRTPNMVGAEWFWNQGWFCNQKRLILKPKPMIPKPRMILKPKKMILKPRMIPKPRTTGNQGSSKNVICKNVVVPPHPTPPHPAFGDDAMQSVAARILVAEWCGFWLRNRPFFGCSIVFFWLRNRIWFWLRNRRNLVAESPKDGCRIGLYSVSIGIKQGII